MSTFRLLIKYRLGGLLLSSTLLAQNNPPSRSLLRDQIGAREYVNSVQAYDEFLSTDVSPLYAVGSKNLSNVRAWIGYSQVETKNTGVVRTQIFKISKDNNWLRRNFQIIVFPHYAVGDLRYVAKIKRGNAKILSGLEHRFKTNAGNVRSEFWEIRVGVLNQEQDIEVEISGLQSSGNNYLYIDSYEIRQVSLANVDIDGSPLYRSFAGTNYISNKVLTNVIRQSKGMVLSYDENNNERWRINLPAGSHVSGGMDYDQDGIIDMSLVYWLSENKSCGKTLWGKSKINLLNGRTGAEASLTNWDSDICWPQIAPDKGMNYATIQWANQSVLFGEDSRIMTSKQYETQSWFYNLKNSISAIGYLFYPSTSSYDYYYQYDKPNAYGNGNSYTVDPHTANGIIANVRGEKRAVFFTSSRVVQYGVESYWSGQLRADYPYLTGGRTDLVGRNYGQIQIDPMNPQLVQLTAGDISYNVYSDMRTGVVGASNPTGGLERHVTVYDMVNNGLSHQYYSYSEDFNHTNAFNGRVTSAAHSIFRVNDDYSRYAYNVYNNSNGWTMAITNSGSGYPAIQLKNIFVWDLVDVDGDGLEEFICSTTNSNNYLPNKNTLILKWSESTKKLTLLKGIQGVIPKLIQRFYEPTRKSSYSDLFDVSLFEKNEKLWMMLYNPTTKKDTAVSIP